MAEPIANTKKAIRIQSADVLRGAVMVLMAIDHVRVYSGMPAGGPDSCPEFYPRRRYEEWYATAPYSQVPEDHRWGLGLLYLVFILVVAVLFLICRWYAEYKAAYPEKGWLKYI